MAAEAEILIIDDEERMLDMLQKVLAREGYSVHTATDGAGGLKVLEEVPVDLVLTDLVMPGSDGIELLKVIKETHPEVPVIMMTAFGTVSSAVEAMKLGAYHYISKPVRNEELSLVIKKGLEETRLRREVAALRQEVSRKYRFGNIIGKSKRMLEVFTLIQRISHSNATVLIMGKSGTGKELVAKAIHYNSPRKDRPFVAIDCGSLPEGLLESELFGHVRGAFTGAIAAKRGLFEEAQRGTLFLDEIGSISLATQAKLLRTLQEREIRPVGGNRSIPVDIRLIAATNEDLEEAVKSGEFREDLYYRLNVIPMYLPALKERREDIPFLAEHFLDKYRKSDKKGVQGISSEAMKLLVYYNWPGNVRELENVIERAVTLARGPVIEVEDLPFPIRGEGEESAIAVAEGEPTLEDLERKYIVKVLKKTGGKKQEAARMLGIDRRTLYRKVRKFMIEEE